MGKRYVEVSCDLDISINDLALRLILSVKGSMRRRSYKKAGEPKV